MSVPYIPHSSSSIYSDDQETLLRGFDNGIQLLTFDEDTVNWSIIMSFLTPQNIIPKIVFVKNALDPSYINPYAVSNLIDNNSDLYTIRYTPSENPFEQGTYRLLSMLEIDNAFVTTLGNTVYYRSLVSVPIENINPIIPIYDTEADAFNAANNEGWVYRDPNNPYDFDDSSISYAGGGTGKFDNASDSIGVPALPTLSAVSAGFVSMYSPTLAQLNSLASFLWTDNMFDPDNFKKLFTDPMECIIGLTIVPVNPTTSGSMSVKVGYVDTGISMARLSSQYAEVNCGTLQADEFWGSALDYSPFTKIHIYLPYVGMREINADDIMGKSVGVAYHIDLLSGACTAFVTAGGSVLYQFNGQCSINIPMAASNFTEMIHSAISAIGAVAMTASGAGAASSAVDAAAVGTAANMGASAANSAISSKPTFSHSGQMGGSGGMLAVQTPYIIIERPRQCVADEVNKFAGFPANITYKLSNLEGYTVVDSIHLDGFSCTDNEADEIRSLLKGGVVL